MGAVRVYNVLENGRRCEDNDGDRAEAVVGLDLAEDLSSTLPREVQVGSIAEI